MILGVYLRISLAHGLIQILVLVNTSLKLHYLVGHTDTLGSLLPRGHVLHILFRFMMEDHRQGEHPSSLIQTGRELFPSPVETRGDRSYVRRGIMATFDETRRDREDAVDVHVDVHGAHCEALVFFLESLGELVGVSDFYVVEQEYIAIVTDPFEHLEYK